jgi:hypothetical protein
MGNPTVNIENLGVWTSCATCGLSSPGREPHERGPGCFIAIDAVIAGKEQDLRDWFAKRERLVQTLSPEKA